MMRRRRSFASEATGGRSKAADRILKSQQSFSLRLYRAILRGHRTRLPPDLRHLGDAYVREEFKQHKTAKAEHLRGFFEGWMGCQFRPPTAHILQVFQCDRFAFVFFLPLLS